MPKSLSDEEDDIVMISNSSEPDQTTNPNKLKSIETLFQSFNFLNVAQLFLKTLPPLSSWSDPSFILDENDLKPVFWKNHWGSIPGISFILAHLHVMANDLPKITVLMGPGHAAPAMLTQNYFDQMDQNSTLDAQRLVQQFSFPNGAPSHCGPNIKGSFHEGGELGYTLVHALGMALNNKQNNHLIVPIIGDGELETATLFSSLFLFPRFWNPATDSAILPILHLNSFKIANPTIASAIGKEQLIKLFQGLHFVPFFVEYNTSHLIMHHQMQNQIREISKILHSIKMGDNLPILILVSPKGWTGPEQGLSKTHQIFIQPIHPDYLKTITDWLKSYSPQDHFDENYRLLETRNIIEHVMVNKRLSTPKFSSTINIPLPVLKQVQVRLRTTLSTSIPGNTFVFSDFVSELIKKWPDSKLMLFSPDEAKSNGLQTLIMNHKKRFPILPHFSPDESFSVTGSVVDSYLNENFCQGLLEGYSLSNRRGIFMSYEAFCPVVVSMILQFAKWYHLSNFENRKFPSIIIVVSSLLWRQMCHYSHQEPFADTIINHHLTKKGIIQIHYPPDSNSMISCISEALTLYNTIEIVHIGKQPCNTIVPVPLYPKTGYMPIIVHHKSHVKLLFCGEIPTMEAMAAHELLQSWTLSIFYSLYIDLICITQPQKRKQIIQCFDMDRLPSVFVHHGQPSAIRGLGWQCNTILGYKGYGHEPTTPFGILIQNSVDRFTIAKKIIKLLRITNQIDIISESKLIQKAQSMKQSCLNHISNNGTDPDLNLLSTCPH